MRASEGALPSDGTYPFKLLVERAHLLATDLVTRMTVDSLADP